MNKEAMYKLSYGLFVLTAKEGKKDNGCIINTAIQAASAPNQLSICINKANATHDMIVNTGKFTVSVLSQAADFELFKRFGFQSGRDVDKFEGYEACRRGENGIYYVTEGTNAYISAKADHMIDLGSHTMFIGEVVSAGVREDLADAAGRFDFLKAGLVAYCHGEYTGLTRALGFFGFSVARPEVLKRRMKTK